MVDNSINKTIKCLSTDNGDEYTSQEFEDYLKQHGIKYQITVSYTPQQMILQKRLTELL